MGKCNALFMCGWPAIAFVSVLLMHGLLLTNPDVRGPNVAAASRWQSLRCFTPLNNPAGNVTGLIRHSAGPQTSLDELFIVLRVHPDVIREMRQPRLRLFSGSGMSLAVDDALGMARNSSTATIPSCIISLLLYLRSVWDFHIRRGLPPQRRRCWRYHHFGELPGPCDNDSALTLGTSPSSAFSDELAKMFDPVSGAALLQQPGQGAVATTCWAHDSGHCLRCPLPPSAPLYCVGMTAPNFHDARGILKKAAGSAVPTMLQHADASSGALAAVPGCNRSGSGSEWASAVIPYYVSELYEFNTPATATRLWHGTLGFWSMHGVLPALQTPVYDFADESEWWAGPPIALAEEIRSVFSHAAVTPSWPCYRLPAVGCAANASMCRASLLPGAGADMQRLCGDAYSLPQLQPASLSGATAKGSTGLPAAAAAAVVAVPYYPRVLVLQPSIYRGYSHALVQEVLAWAGAAPRLLSDPARSGLWVGVYDWAGNAGAGGVDEAADSGLALRYLLAIFGPALRDRLVGPPLLAGEYLSPEAQSYTIHAPTAAAANRVIRDNLRLEARPAIACEVHSMAFQPDDAAGALPRDSGVDAHCVVPAEATLPWVLQHWGVPPYSPGHSRAAPPPPVAVSEAEVAAAATRLRLPRGNATSRVGSSDDEVPSAATRALGRELTLLLVVRAGTRRVRNAAELWAGLAALSDRMLARRAIRTRFLVHRSEDAALVRDPVTTFKLFHQADVIVAVHGAGLSAIAACRPGTHLLEVALAGHLTGHPDADVYLMYARLGAALGMFVTSVYSEPAADGPRAYTGAAWGASETVVVDLSALLAHAEAAYANHDFGPREYDRPHQKPAEPPGSVL